MRRRALAIAFCLLQGCVDLTPVTVPDAATPQDAEMEKDLDRHALCRLCIAAPNLPGPGCGNQLDACQATDRCREIYDCVYASGCFAGANRNEVISCGIPCASEAGALNPDDPAIVAVLAITDCAYGPCLSICTGDE